MRGNRVIPNLSLLSVMFSRIPWSWLIRKNTPRKRKKKTVEKAWISVSHHCEFLLFRVFRFSAKLGKSWFFLKNRICLRNPQKSLIVASFMHVFNYNTMQILPLFSLPPPLLQDKIAQGRVAYTLRYFAPTSSAVSRISRYIPKWEDSICGSSMKDPCK